MYHLARLGHEARAGGGTHAGMLAVQRINHNACICVDGAGRQLIALGKGIGFGDYPHDVPLRDIQRTFYNVDPKYLSFVEQVDPEVLEFSAQLADVVVRQVDYELSPNLPITLADHIQFAIRRAHEGIMVTLPGAAEIQQSHPVEYKLGEMARRGIERTFGVRLRRQEAGGIALSIVNSAVTPSELQAREDRRRELVLARATRLVEERLGPVDRDSFAYARFATHVGYLLGRVAAGAPLESDNAELYATMAAAYPQVEACCLDIGREVAREYGQGLTEEELVYLMLHVNRLVPQEGPEDAI